MKYLSSVLFTITISQLLVIALSSAPGYSLKGSFPMFSNAPGMGFQSSNGFQLVFSGPNSNKFDIYMVNSSSGTITPMQSPYVSICSSANLAMSSQQNFYCWDSRNNWIAQVDPLNNFKIIKSFKDPLTMANFAQNGDFIVLSSGTANTKIFSMIANDYVFNMDNGLQLGLCPTQNSLYYVKKDDLASNSYQVLNQAYNSNNPTTVLKFGTSNTSFPTIVQLFNHSSVGVVGLLNQDASYSFFTFSNNTVGSVITNSSTSDISGTIYPVNDTHFVLVTPAGAQYELGLYYITPSLSSVKAGSIKFPGEFQATPIVGGNQIMVSLDGVNYAKVNLATFSIVQFYPFAMNPFQLSNGSWVELSYLGYFIYDPSYKTLLNYQMIFFSDIYVEPQFGNSIYGLYFGAEDSQKRLTTYLWNIQKNTSTIKTLTLPSTPTQALGFALQDVYQDSNGNLGVVMKATNQYYYVIYNTKIQGPFQQSFATGNLYVLAFPDYPNNILHLVDPSTSGVGAVTLYSINITTNTLVHQSGLSLAGCISKINIDQVIFTTTDIHLSTTANIYSISQGKVLTKAPLSVKQTTSIAPVFLNNQVGFVTRSFNQTVNLCNANGDCTSVSQKLLTTNTVRNAGGNQFSIFSSDRQFYGYFSLYAMTSYSEEQEIKFLSY